MVMKGSIFFDQIYFFYLNILVSEFSFCHINFKTGFTVLYNIYILYIIIELLLKKKEAKKFIAIEIVYLFFDYAFFSVINYSTNGRMIRIKINFLRSYFHLFFF